MVSDRDGGQRWVGDLVTSEAFEAGLREGAGGYEVLCGRRIASASMVTEPDCYCRPCQVIGAWT
ncbi:MAG: hypothetical protein ACRDQ4_22605 [Pseudonocardiaceae bacterium]